MILGGDDREVISLFLYQSETNARGGNRPQRTLSVGTSLVSGKKTIEKVRADKMTHPHSYQVLL